MKNKKTKGYTKSKIDIMQVFMNMKTNAFAKSPDEPLDKWIIRKSEEAIYGGTDERGTDRKEGAQNPNPPFLANDANV